MPFISNKTRSKLVNKVSRYTAGRKVFLVTTVVLCVAYLIVLLISLFIAASVKDNQMGKWQDWLLLKVVETDEDIITPLGWVMLVTGIVCLVSLALSLVIVFSIPSPNSVKQSINTLASSPYARVKIQKSKTPTKVVKERFSRKTFKALMKERAAELAKKEAEAKKVEEAKKAVETKKVEESKAKPTPKKVVKPAATVKAKSTKKVPTTKKKPASKKK